jgi:hypothetical protein
MYKTINLILMPFIWFTLAGAAGGALITPLGRLLSIGLTSKQEWFSFIGFTVLFGLQGLVYSILNAISWWRYRKNLAKETKNASKKSGCDC